MVNILSPINSAQILSWQTVVNAYLALEWVDIHMKNIRVRSFIAYPDQYNES